MPVIGTLPLGGAIPRIAAAFTDHALQSDVDEARRAGLDVAEVRIDRFQSYEKQYVVGRIARFRDIPTIATIRLEIEGGEWRGSEEERQILFRSIIPDIDAIDVELRATSTVESIIPLVKEKKKTLIISYHDFDTTPDLQKLQSVISRARNIGADIIKIATKIPDNGFNHIGILTQLLVQHRQENMIVIGMGEEGGITRLMFPRLGSLLTFASWGGLSTAPGQMPYCLMSDIFRKIYPAYGGEKI